MALNNQISEEYLKCLLDKSRIYMIENYLKTYDLTTRRFVPFKLFPKQKEFINALAEFDENLATKPRQAGVTTTAAAFIACVLALADDKSPETVLIVANRLDLSRLFLKKIKEFILQLPRWFWGDEYYSIDPRSDKNKKKIFEEENKDSLKLFNGCIVKAISSGESAARGVSAVSWLIFDEAAFIDNGVEVFSQAVATTASGGHIIMISTPNGKDQLYYNTYNQAKMGKNGYHITELKWYQDPRYSRYLKWHRNVIKTIDGKDISEEEWFEEEHDSDGYIKYDEEHWENLEAEGWKPTSPWYEKMCRKFNNDSQRIAQELDVSFIGSSDNVVSPETIEMQEKRNVRPYIFTDDIIKETWIWKKPIEGHRYIMPIDASRGDAADNSVIQILDIDAIDDNGNPIIEQVLEYYGKMPGDMLGEIAYRYGLTYNNAFAIVDCIGGVGDACVLTMMSLGYSNLYYDDPNLKDFTIESRYIKSPTNDSNKLPGFHSSGVRFQMLSGFAAALRDNAIIIRSKRVITELETWIFRNGRMDHMSGFHDDTLTCLAMGYFVLQFSFKKLEAAISKDKVILKSWITAANLSNNNESHFFQKNNVILPFYSSKMLNKDVNENKIKNELLKEKNTNKISNFMLSLMYQNIK
jgi:hypothetical protein